MSKLSYFSVVEVTFQTHSLFNKFKFLIVLVEKDFKIASNDLNLKNDSNYGSLMKF